jgi:hypothetical protein
MIGGKICLEDVLLEDEEPEADRVLSTGSPTKLGDTCFEVDRDVGTEVMEGSLVLVLNDETTGRLCFEDVDFEVADEVFVLDFVLDFVLRLDDVRVETLVEWLELTLLLEVGETCFVVAECPDSKQQLRS